MNATSQTSETVEGWEAAFPSGEYQFVNTDIYRLPVDYTYTLEQNGENTRIQNFVGSDDPGFVYTDNAFFIEIGTTAMPRSEIAEIHESTETVILAGETVMRGNNRAVGGESWSGHSYFNNSNDILIFLSYRHPAGEALAEAVIQQIHWNE